MGTTTKFILNGKEVNEPKEAIPKVGEEGIIVAASFGFENVQPQIDPLQFTFTNEAAQLLRTHVADGDIYQGVDIQVDILGQSGVINAVNGYLDLAEKFIEISPVQVVSEIKFKESTLSLAEKIESVTLDLMDAIGVITQADYVNVDFVVEKPINVVETAIISVTIFLMIKELAETIEKISSDTATVLGLTSTAATGGIGAVVYQVAILVVRATYAAVLLRSIIGLMKDLLESFISPVRTHKAITYRTALEKTFNYLGYDFVSPITELDNYTYLPSSPSEGKTLLKGTPRANDYGYNFGEFVKLASDQFNAKIAVLDGDLHFRTESDVFWLKNSTYVMPDVILEDINTKQYNAGDIIKSTLLKYRIDDSDWWTSDNLKGTSFGVEVQHSPEISDLKVSGLTGFEKINYPIALGNRKDGLNLLEEALKILAKAVDTITNVFGSGQNFAQQIEKRVGMLKVSHEVYSLPKVLFIVGGSIPKDHRDLLSAKQSWNDFNSFRSFVSNDFQRQRDVFEGVEIPFGLDNYNETIKNSFFKTDSGRNGKFVNLRWSLEKNRAIVDFWIERVNTRKLKEIFIEQE